MPCDHHALVIRSLVMNSPGMGLYGDRPSLLQWRKALDAQWAVSNTNG